MLRILSAAILLPIVIGTIWFFPSEYVLVVAELFLVMAFLEYAAIVRRLGVEIPKIFGAASACALAASPLAFRTEDVLMVTTILLGLLVVVSKPRNLEAFQTMAGTLFGVLYLGLPFGSLVAIHSQFGRRATLVLLITVMISDTVQYYGGRALGRRPLAPTISPKKTIEGAVFGVVFGMATFVTIGWWWLPRTAIAVLLVFGSILTVVAMVGDLFESLLKRTAGMKDASTTIPGHGGVLDRIDSLLFAAPAYYMFMRYVY